MVDAFEYFARVWDVREETRFWYGGSHDERSGGGGVNWGDEDGVTLADVGMDSWNGDRLDFYPVDLDDGQVRVGVNCEVEGCDGGVVD